MSDVIRQKPDSVMFERNTRKACWKIVRHVTDIVGVEAWLSIRDENGTFHGWAMAYQIASPSTGTCPPRGFWSGVSSAKRWVDDQGFVRPCQIGREFLFQHSFIRVLSHALGDSANGAPHPNPVANGGSVKRGKRRSFDAWYVKP